MMDGNMSMGPCDSMSGMNMSMNGMAMQFFFGYQCDLLFSNLNLDTPAGLLGGIIMVIVVAVLYEGLKTVREILASYSSKSSNKTKDGASGGDTGVQNPSHTDSDERAPLVATKKSNRVMQLMLNNWLDPIHALQSILHVLQVGVAYLLMLVAMTYNGWLFLSVCIGAGLGYFIFARCRRSVDAFRKDSDHCHN